MNDKCAAGTGRFLEMMAKTLGLSLEEMSVKGLEWKHNIVISSMCTVFAESESCRWWHRIRMWQILSTV